MMTYRKREQSLPYERGDHAPMDEADANVVGLTEKPDYNKEVSVLSDEEQNRIKSEVYIPLIRNKKFMLDETT